MRRALPLVLFVLTALPARASAQSLFAFEIPLAPEGAIVGRLVDAPLTLVRWIGPSEASVRFEDHTLRLEVPVALGPGRAPAEPRTQVVVGVGRTVPVRVGPWRVTMAAGAWAPLRGHDGELVRVALPPGLPEAEGLVALPPGRGPRSAPARAFDHPAASAQGFELACDGQLEVRAGVAQDAARWAVPADATFRVRGRRAPFAVEVRVQGFTVHGFVDARPARCEASLGAFGAGSGCGDGLTRGLIVEVPAGTPLYASPSATEPFAWTRSVVIAREDLESARGQVCAGVEGGPITCAPSPPLPTGSQTLLFDREAERERGPDWSFLAHVRLPFESLRIVEGPGGFGACWAPPSDWPR